MSAQVPLALASARLPRDEREGCAPYPGKDRGDQDRRDGLDRVRQPQSVDHDEAEAIHEPRQRRQQAARMLHEQARRHDRDEGRTAVRESVPGQEPPLRISRGVPVQNPAEAPILSRSRLARKVRKAGPEPALTPAPIGSIQGRSIGRPRAPTAGSSSDA